MDEILPPTRVSIGVVARELGLSISRVRQLADEGALPFVLTEGGHRRFDPAEIRRAWTLRRGSAPIPADAELPGDAGAVLTEETWPLAGLAEDTAWKDVRRQLDDRLDLSPAAHRILGYAFTEMVNNAIDHSDGRSVSVRVLARAGSVVVDIADDGRGVFSHLREARGLLHDTDAIGELTKGKVTTAAAGHSGEGIFFTSKAVDVFRLASDGLLWIVDNLRHDVAVGSSDTRSGTRVVLELRTTTDRELAEVFRRFTDDTDFDRTSPVVRLFGLGVEFVSRSEAKRLAAGLERFTDVELDFGGVESVGQGFVDELFRVWAGDHPATALRPTNMNEGVAFMVRRGLPTRGLPTQ